MEETQASIVFKEILDADQVVRPEDMTIFRKKGNTFPLRAEGMVCKSLCS